MVCFDAGFCFGIRVSSIFMKLSALNWDIRSLFINAYTYLADEKRIFRYDNAPHHPEISTHPHHKHIGEREKLSAADEPTLSQILDEVQEVLKEK